MSNMVISFDKSFSICSAVYDFLRYRRYLISISVVREMVPKRVLFSTSFTISYGAFQSSFFDTVSVSCMSQLIITSVSKRILVGSMNYFFILPNDELLSSRINSVDVFPFGIMPEYCPKSLSETFPLSLVGFFNILRELIASFKVEGIYYLPPSAKLS